MIEEFSGQFIKLKNYCLSKELFCDQNLVILGLSGGLDSVCLFHFLLWLQERNIYQNLKIVGAHLNHTLRPEADQDELFSQELCERNNIPFYSKKVDVSTLAAERGYGIEEAGRFARHSFFNELMQQFSKNISTSNRNSEAFLGKKDNQKDPSAFFPGCSRNKAGTQRNNAGIQGNKAGIQSKIVIALAHHQDDQAESVIMNIGRGSGIDGICTLKPKDQYYRRPLLALSRSEILTLAQEQNWQWVEDQSNALPDYLRNRIRHQLIPVWNKTTGYDVRPLLARLAANLQEDQLALSWMKERVLVEAKTPNGELSLSVLRKLPKSMLKSVLDSYIVESGYQNILLSQLQLEQIARVINGKHGNKIINISGNLSFKRERNRFFIVR